MATILSNPGLSRQKNSGLQRPKRDSGLESPEIRILTFGAFKCVRADSIAFTRIQDRSDLNGKGPRRGPFPFASGVFQAAAKEPREEAAPPPGKLLMVFASQMVFSLSFAMPAE